MRMRGSRPLLLLGLCAGAMPEGGGIMGQQKALKAKLPCSQVVLEGDVKAGEGFQRMFTPGLVFYLEPLRSGWIVRVLAANEPRGPHDSAELATPPYRSVSPLLVSTDWSFRAQDAVGWNRRRFRYAATAGAFRELAAEYDGVMRNEAASAGKAAGLAARQPEGLLEILDARIVPGLNDQAKMAAPVAQRFAETPHTVDEGIRPSALGRLEELHFRVRLDLKPGVLPAKGVPVQDIACALQPA